MIDHDESRIAACERELRRLRITLSAVIGVFTLAALAWISLSGLAPTAVAQSQSLRLRELVIVDDRGVERARLGGHLPDPVIGGKRGRRGGQAAGLLIYDDTGQERGGYLTFDEPSGNAILTLDTRTDQVAYLAADKREGIALRVWTGGHAVEVRADSAGARTTTTHDGHIVSLIPALSDAEAEAMCAGLKSDLAGLNPKPPLETVLAACAQRMPESACRKCLGLK